VYVSRRLDFSLVRGPLSGIIKVSPGGFAAGHKFLPLDLSDRYRIYSLPTSPPSPRRARSRTAKPFEELSRYNAYKYCKSVFHKDKSEYRRTYVGTHTQARTGAMRRERERERGGGRGGCRIFIAGALRRLLYVFITSGERRPLYRSNIFRYCGHDDVLSGRHCITDAKKRTSRRRDREKLRRCSGSAELLHAFSGTSWTGLPAIRD